MSTDTWSDWLASLASLTTDPEARQAFRERRFEYAHRIGDAFREWIHETGGDRSVIYAVCLSDGAPVYVGQTPKPSRRLYDLPIGESHHLANTYPPELWRRVVVLDWTRVIRSEDLDARLNAACNSGNVASKPSTDKIGMVLEHILQLRFVPEMNASRKTTRGALSSRDLARSRSAGARLAVHLNESMTGAVSAFGDLLTAAEESHVSQVRTPAGIVLFPRNLGRRSDVARITP